jgi:hypothetical protein
MTCRVTRTLTCCLLWLVITDAALPVCRGASHADARLVGATQAARVGREFKIRVGRRVTLKGEGLRLRFVSVDGDSRCPEGVTCVWAGDAEVLLEADVRGGGRKRLKLHTNANPQTKEEDGYRRYRVKLVGLSPYPRSGRKIAPGEYTATLLVSKD